MTFQDAIKVGSFYEDGRLPIHKGNVEAGLQQAEVVLEGEVKVGGQEHFYLETQVRLK